MGSQTADQIRSMAKLRARSGINLSEEYSPLKEDKIDDTLILPENKTVSGFAQNLDLKIKKLKRSLEGWREIILSAQSVLLWEKQWHPGALFGISTTLFLFLWIVDPSILTTISVLGLIITVCDYLVPTVVTGFLRNDNWTGTQEKKFEELCRTLVLYYTHALTTLASFYLMRTVRPKVYYTVLVISLLILAWLGNTVNNLLLTYIVITWLLLAPGLEHKGLLCKYTGCLTTKFKEALKLNSSTKTD